MPSTPAGLKPRIEILHVSVELLITGKESMEPSGPRVVAYGFLDRRVNDVRVIENAGGPRVHTPLVAANRWGPFGSKPHGTLTGLISLMVHDHVSGWVHNPGLCTDRQGVCPRALAKRAGRRPHDPFERTAEGGLGFVAESCRHFGDGQSPGP